MEYDKYLSIYDENTLKHWQGRYPKNVQRNFDDVLLPRLLPNERQALGRVKLLMPLFGEGITRFHPLAFYSSSTSQEVVLPIFSIKFLDDISIAAAWLNRKGCSLETLYDYIAMLKYRSPRFLPNGIFPPPLEALHIPGNALDDPDVDDLSQKILKTSLIWVLAHELGHVLLGHRGYDGISAEEAQESEMRADHFATEMFRRIGTYPGGMAILLMALAYWSPNRGDFSGDAPWEEYLTNTATHPLSSQRLKMIGDDLASSPDGFAASEPNRGAARQAVLYIAEQMEEVATKFTPDVQRLIRARGLTITPESLAPRRPGEVVVSLDQVTVSPGSPPFHGLYQGEHSRMLADEKTESLEASMLLHRNRDRVTGRFTFGLGEGTIQGQVASGELYYDWGWSGVRGKGIFRSISSGELAGTWGYDDSRVDGGWWAGLRD